MGNKTEFETRNGQELGNETEFESRYGRKWETRRDKKHNFSFSARQDFNKISDNAENGNKNKNKVFSNVTKRRFKRKKRGLGAGLPPGETEAARKD